MLRLKAGLGRITLGTYLWSNRHNRHQVHMLLPQLGVLLTTPVLSITRSQGTFSTWSGNNTSNLTRQGTPAP
jgi:multisubunit Na+/H+ antiporter MnhG subunit